MTALDPHTDPESQGWIPITPAFIARQVELASQDHVDGQIARLWILAAIREGAIDPRSVPPRFRPQAQLEDARRFHARRRAEYDRRKAQLDKQPRPKPKARRRKATAR